MYILSSPSSNDPRALSTPLTVAAAADSVPDRPADDAVSVPADKVAALRAEPVIAADEEIPTAVMLPDVRIEDAVTSTAVTTPVVERPALEMTPLVETPATVTGPDDVKPKPPMTAPAALAVPLTVS